MLKNEAETFKYRPVHAMLQNWNHDKINIVVNQFFLPGCIKCLNFKKSKLIYTLSDNNFN